MKHLLLLLVTPILFFPQVTYEHIEYNPPDTPWEGYSALKEICTCESGLTHYDGDGSVIQGRVNPKDVGICQVNLTYHQKSAERLGYNLFKREDNIAYAKHLYNNQGPQPWFWSSDCWKSKLAQNG